MYLGEAMNQNVSNDSSTTTGSADQISRRAYELWENEGRPEGSDMKHWLQAEKEFSTSSKSAPASSPTQSSVRNTSADTRPLQGTRAGAAAAPAASSSKRNSSTPFGTDKNGQGQNASKRKPTSAPMM